jgi:hypothetical protein
VNSLGFANTNDLLFTGGIEVEVGCFIGGGGIEVEVGCFIGGGGIGTNLSNDDDVDLLIGTDTDVRGGDSVLI